jgi:hypothetical protein
MLLKNIPIFQQKREPAYFIQKENEIRMKREQDIGSKRNETERKYFSRNY